MSTSKKPSKPSGARKRGRPADRLAMSEEQAMGALDRMLGKKPAPQAAGPEDRVPTVRSKRPKK